MAGASDREQVVRWCREFCVDVGEQPSLDLIDSGSWADSRFGDRHFTFRETPDGTPVSMAAATSIVGGMIRVDPVCTPAHLRGRGYAGAVTAEVSRAALAAGATDVVLFTDPDNPTSNALYQRIGYVHVADFAGYRFSYGAPATDRRAGDDAVVRTEADEVDEVIVGELRLMDPGVRTSRELAAQLLDPEFVEVGASGRRWSYEQMLAELPDMAGNSENGPRYEPSDMTGVVLAPGLVHLTYETVIGGRRARCSSLWRKRGEETGWQMYYHQATPVPPEAE